MNNGKDPPPCAYYHFIKKEMVKTSSLVGRKEGMREGSSVDIVNVLYIKRNSVLEARFEPMTLDPVIVISSSLFLSICS